MLLQLNIVVLIGGILVERYGNYRDRAKAENAFRKDLLAGMMRAYNDTKKVGRTLKANVVRNRSASDQVEIPWAVYERQLEYLNDPQLEFELFKRQLWDVPAFYRSFGNGEDICKRLEALKRYLNKIIRAYDSGEYR